MEKSNEEYLTVAELSERIKFSKQTIYNLIFKGEFILKHHYLKPRPKKILFKWSAVEAWLEGPLTQFITKDDSLQDQDDDHNQKSLIDI